ncbi:MAG: hypothetical protein ACI31C_00550 [Muribaculaceae bacterium]
MATTDATLFVDPAAEATQPKNNGNKSNVGVAAAATAAAGAGVGAAGVWAVNQADDAEEVEGIEIEEAENVGAHRTTTDNGQDPTTTTPGANTTTPGATAPGVNPVATPSTPGETTTPVNPTTGETPVDPSNPANPSTPGDITGETPVNPTTPPAETPVEVDPQVTVSDPNEIADAVIAGEEVDPNDLDGVSMLEFTDVEVVYDIEGNATTQATFIDYEGDMGVAVDLDGDGILDVAVYDDPQFGSYNINGAGFTVAQAQEQAEDGYLAYDETTDNIDVDIDDQDIIITDDLA